MNRRKHEEESNRDLEIIFFAVIFSRESSSPKAWAVWEYRLSFCCLSPRKTC